MTLMTFCDVCQNMLYLSIAPDTAPPALKYACKNCGFSRVEEGALQESACVLENNYGDTQDASHQMYITPYIKFDPTLPRVNNIACPQEACLGKKKGGTPEVIYMKVDPENMKYVYFCCHCEHFWRST